MNVSREVARMKVKTPVESFPTAVICDQVSEPRQTSRLYRVLDTLFGIDVRTLALFRIGLGLILIADLLYRARDLEAHYTDFGVIPVALLRQMLKSHYYLTIHTLALSLTGQVVLFVIAGVFALALMVGYQTRLTSIVSWFLLISLQNRNPIILGGEDGLIRMMAFWGMFLPLGACWSVDRALSRTPVAVPKRLLSVGTACLMLQVCFVYWFTSLWKSGPTWHKEGTAVYLALTFEQFATPLGKRLATMPHSFLTFLTLLTTKQEAFGPTLALLGGFYPPLRVAMVFAFIGFHIALGSCMELGLFPLFCAGAWVIFLPGWFWDSLAKLTARWRRKPGGLPMPQSLPTAPRRLHARKQPVSLPKPKSRLALPLWLRPRTIRLTPHWTLEIIAGFFLVYILGWNIRTLYTGPVKWFPRSLNWIGEITRVDQQWDMFSPDVPTSHGWLVAPAWLNDKTELDLLNEVEPINWSQPALISATYFDDRWRKYLTELCRDQNTGHRYYFAQYLRRRWNRNMPPERHVHAISLIYMRQLALPNYRLSEREPVMLCGYEFHDD